jgi:hypothetical protein
MYAVSSLGPQGLLTTTCAADLESPRGLPWAYACNGHDATMQGSAEAGGGYSIH